MTKIMWIIAGVTLLGAVLWGPIVSNVEQARYSVVKADGPIEIRDYEAMIVAQAEASGERKEAINQGFRTIADYIFGNNVAAQKVAMTAPVTQAANEKIAMTAPVTQQSANGSWTVRFVMPASYTLGTLPKPANAAVTLLAVPAKRFAVIRFSGMAGEESLKQQTAQLMAYLDSNGLKPQSTATYAFYNPPWTLPMLRRNEVMVEIAR